MSDSAPDKNASIKRLQLANAAQHPALVLPSSNDDRVDVTQKKRTCQFLRTCGEQVFDALNADLAKPSGKACVKRRSLFDRAMPGQKKRDVDRLLATVG
jgi:hypothetical protein